MVTAKQFRFLNSTVKFEIVSYEESTDTFKILQKISIQKSPSYFLLTGQQLSDWFETQEENDSHSARGLRAIGEQITGDTDIPFGLVGLHATVDVYLPHERMVL